MNRITTNKCFVLRVRKTVMVSMSTRTCIHTYVHTCIRAYVHTYIRLYVYTYIRTYVHIHTYIHHAGMHFADCRSKAKNTHLATSVDPLVGTVLLNL